MCERKILLGLHVDRVTIRGKTAQEIYFIRIEIDLNIFRIVDRFNSEVITLSWNRKYRNILCKRESIIFKQAHVSNFC